MEIFVGNLPFEIGEQEVRDAFSAHGEVASVKILTDKFTGRSRGIGFVVMEDEEQAKAAVAALNGSELGGRALRVDQSRPKEDRFTGFGGGFKPRFGGGGGGREGGGFRRGGGGGGGFNKGGFKPRGGGFKPRGERRPDGFGD